MRVGIHQSGQNRRVAQIDEVPCIGRITDTHNPTTGQRDDAIRNGRPINGKYPASAIGNGGNGIVHSE